MAVGAELEIELPEQVGLRIVDLRGGVCARVEAVLRGKDLLNGVEALRRDPDPRRVSVGSELDGRRERAVVVAEVAGEEEMQLVANDWPPDRDAVLLLLIIAHRDRNAVRVRADEVLILHVTEQR